jgi:hypothetical protein
VGNDIAESGPSTRSPGQRLLVFVSANTQELAAECNAVLQVITRLRQTPVRFDPVSRPHAPRSLYQAYLPLSDVFIGIYWEKYGWVAPGESISGLEDEYNQSKA